MALNKNVAKSIKTRQGNELRENNKLIAEFMNYPDLGTEGDFSYLKYNTSWDWLMPVVESCFERLDSKDSSADEIKRQLLVCNLRGVYTSVVEFIKWYNENKED